MTDLLLLHLLPQKIVELTILNKILDKLGITVISLDLRNDCHATDVFFH